MHSEHQRYIHLRFASSQIVTQYHKKPLHEHLNRIDDIRKLKIALFLLIYMEDLHNVLDNAVQADGYILW